MRPLVFLILALGLATTVSAQDDVVNLSTTVKGNQEHPSVTYIVPWRQAADETALTMPFNTKTRLSEVFEHVERAEHQRQLEYLKQVPLAEVVE